MRLTFDRGFQRELALTMSEAYNRKMLRGPQPETVRDYRLVWDECALEVQGNYQRLRVHRLAEPASRRLRLEILRTHGDPCARLFEIRGVSIKSGTVSMQGIVVPLITPLTAEGEIDESGIERLVDFVIRARVHGVLALGSSGELVSLSARKKRLVAPEGG